MGLLQPEEIQGLLDAKATALRQGKHRGLTCITKQEAAPSTTLPFSYALKEMAKIVV